MIIKSDFANCRWQSVSCMKACTQCNVHSPALASSTSSSAASTPLEGRDGSMIYVPKGVNDGQRYHQLPDQPVHCLELGCIGLYTPPLGSVRIQYGFHPKWLCLTTRQYHCKWLARCRKFHWNSSIQHHRAITSLLILVSRLIIVMILSCVMTNSSMAIFSKIMVKSSWSPSSLKAPRKYFNHDSPIKVTVTNHQKQGM